MSSSPCASRVSVQELPSSPPPHHATNTATTSRKIKKAPPITPKRFTKFFTPRTSSHGSIQLSKSGRQLQDITRAAVNVRNSSGSHKSTPRKTVNFVDIDQDGCVHTPQLSSRKRKTPYLSPATSPAQSSPSKRAKFISPTPFTILEDPLIIDEPPVYPSPIRRLKSLGGTSRKLERSFGGMLAVGRGLRRDHCTSWEDQTSNFYSTADDCHELSHGAPPFCTASCNGTLERFSIRLV